MADELSSRSPLEGLSLARFNGKTYAQETLVQTVTGQVMTLIRNNPNRVFWVATNLSTVEARVSIDPAFIAANGFILAAGGGGISEAWEEDGETVGYQHFVISSGGVALIKVREVIRE